jgi:hypothetical protein
MSKRDDLAGDGVRVEPAPTPDWLSRMQEDFRKTGSYRPEDVRKLLGDQTSRVDFGPKSNPASFYSKS